MSLWGSFKKIVKSPVTKAAAGGLAVVFPPVGLPAAAAVATADTVIRVAEKGTPKQKKAARKLIAGTKRAAARGDDGASRALGTMRQLYRARKATRRAGARAAVARAAGGLHVDAGTLRKAKFVLRVG